MPDKEPKAIIRLDITGEGLDVVFYDTSGVEAYRIENVLPGVPEFVEKVQYFAKHLETVGPLNARKEIQLWEEYIKGWYPGKPQILSPDTEWIIKELMDRHGLKEVDPGLYAKFKEE